MRRFTGSPVCGTKSHLAPILSVNRGFSVPRDPPYPQMAAQSAVEPANPFSLHGRHDVRVPIEGDGHAGMAQHLSATTLGFTQAVSITVAAGWRKSCKRVGGSPSRRSSGRRRPSVMRDPVSGSPNSSVNTKP